MEGEEVGRGRQSILRRYNNHVVKCFNPSVPLWEVELEANNSRVVSRLGLPVPAVLDVVELDGGMGIIYDYVPGKTMQEILMCKPGNLRKYGILLAKLHLKVHQVRVDRSLPAQKEKLQHKIAEVKAIPQEIARGLLNKLQALPAGDRVCHGDFHPGNILLTGKGPVIIDWMDAVQGNSAGDVARTLLLLRGAARGKYEYSFLKRLAIRILLQIYRKNYQRARPLDFQNVYSWIPLIACGRMGEEIEEEREFLINIIERRAKED